MALPPFNFICAPHLLPHFVEFGATPGGYSVSGYRTSSILNHREVNVAISEKRTHGVPRRDPEFGSGSKFA